MTLSDARQLLSLCCLFLTNSSNSLSAAEDKPNIVIILADDLGYGDLSCYDGWIKTPHIDALAAGGLKFTDFHSSGAVCSPTRAGLMTGRYQQKVGIPGVVTAKGHRDKGLTTKHFTIAELVKLAGYSTAMYGKWHLGYQPKFNPVYHGFDQFRGYVSGNIDFFSHIDQVGKSDWWNATEKVVEEGYVTHLITKHALNFMQANREKPFLLYLAHEAPHYPYQGPNDKAERTVDGKFETLGSRSDKKEAYREMVSELDNGVGAVVGTLKEFGLTENTFVFFFSDNGATKLGSNGKLHGFKGSVWEGGHRVPAIANWPGKIAAGKVTHETAICLDLLPTVAAITGAKIPNGHPLDGVDLSPVLFQGKNLPSRTLFWKHGNQRAARQGPWKLVVQGKSKKNKTVNNRPQLFHLGDDGSETKPLNTVNPDRLQVLRTALENWELEIGPDQFGG